MASGSFEFSTRAPGIKGRLTWEQTSNGSEKNTSTVQIRVHFQKTVVDGYISGGTITTRVIVDGHHSQAEENYNITLPTGEWVLSFAKAYTVWHNDDGKKNCNIRVYGNASFSLGSFDASKTVTFDTIPRYTTISEFKNTAVSYNTATFSWATADTVSKIVCKFNGTEKYTASVNNTNGTFTISGLSEITAYSNIILTVTRKDSGLTTDSSPISVTTTYKTPSPKLSLVSRGINSLRLYWTSDYSIDTLWCYNSGTLIYTQTNVNAISGYFTLAPSNWSDIQPGTTYSLGIAVRRKITGDANVLGVYSNVVVSTLPAPTISTSTPTSFTIGDTIPITINNSGNSAYYLYFQIYNTEGSWETLVHQSYAIGTQSVNLKPDSSDIYENCPESNSIRARIVCALEVNEVTYSSYYYITGYVDGAQYNFTLEDFTIETNRNTDINTVIGKDGDMIAGFGNLWIKFPANAATPVAGASVTSIVAEIKSSENIVNSITYEYTSSVLDLQMPTHFIPVGINTIEAYAIDSRGNKSNVVSKEFQVYAYHSPTVSIALQRYNNFEDKILINLIANVSRLLVSSVAKNSISSLKYRYAESGTSYPSSYTNISGYTTSVNGEEQVITLVKNTNTNYFISLDYEKSYNFQFTIEDKIGTTTYEVFVAQGKPCFGIFDNGVVTVDRIPDFESNAKLQVNGDISVVDSDGNEKLLTEDFQTKTGDLKDNITTFTKSAVRTSLVSGEKLSTSLGKISKYFNDIKSHAFITPVQTLTTTVAGNALDATMGKKLNDNLENKIIIGSEKDAMIIVSNPTLTFSNGQATVNMSSTASAYSKNINNVVAQLKVASSAVITSATVSNNSITVRCANLSGTAFSGRIGVTLVLFLV